MPTRPGGATTSATRRRGSTPAAVAGFAATAPCADEPVAVMDEVAARLKATGQDCLPFLRRVQRAHPADIWANVLLANECNARHDYATAIRFYQAVVALRPDAGVVHSNLGLALAAVGQIPEAVEEFRDAIRTAPEASVPHELLGLALVTTGHGAEGTTELERASELGTRNPRVEAQLGEELAVAGRFAEAAHHYRRALGLGFGPQADRDRVVQHLRMVARRQMVQLTVERRPDDLWVARQEAADDGPPRDADRDGYAELALFVGREEDYRAERSRLLAKFGDRDRPGDLRADRAGRPAPTGVTGRAAGGDRPGRSRRPGRGQVPRVGRSGAPVRPGVGRVPGRTLRGRGGDPGRDQDTAERTGSEVGRGDGPVPARAGRRRPPGAGQRQGRPGTRAGRHHRLQRVGPTTSSAGRPNG